jgi:hypothetical protein
MKNLYKVLGIIALIAVIGFSAVSCKDKEDGEDEGKVSGGAKSITITGLPSGTHYEIEIEIFSDDDDYIAWGEEDEEFSGSSFTVPLYDANSEFEKPWTGSGSYYIWLELDEEDEYYYTGGKTFEQLGMTEDDISKLPKYNIKDANSIIHLNQFKAIPDSFWDEGK